MPRSSGFGRQILSSKILLILSLVILIFFSTNLVKQVINRRDLQKEVSALEEEINRLQGRNQELDSLIGYFESLDFVEKEARTKLNLRKPGEQIIIVEEEPAESRLTESVKDVPVDLVSGEIVILTNAEKWWNYFFIVN